MLDRLKIITPSVAVHLLAQTCSGLHFAHRSGILHQDINPTNIFVQRDDHVKILDFGLACPLGAEDRSIFDGTIYYMAPEQIRCETVDLEVPAQCELVLEGRITARPAGEGPFIDLTETWDIVRQQPVIEIDALTHRRSPVYHALLPGGLEHKLLMGLPREPTVFQEVDKVAECRGVNITPGGMSWLHAVVQIAKKGPEDGRKSIEAAFRGHTSLKHVVVVDEDVDGCDPMAVEWAVATRFQADRDLMVFEDQPSSSLDPSARQVPGQKARTAKMGLDATIPWVDHAGDPVNEDERAGFCKVGYGDVDLARYLREAL